MELIKLLEVLYLNAKNFLNKVCEEIKYRPVRNGIFEELEQHINEIKEENINKGMQEESAEEKAVLQMGDAEQIGKKLNKIHRPKLDWKLIILISILIGFGVLVTIIKTSSNSMFTISANITNAIRYILLGIVLSVGIYFFDYRKLKKHSILIYLIATVIMLLARIPGIGVRVNGIVYARLFMFSYPVATVTLSLYLIAFIGFIAGSKKDNIIKIQLFDKEHIINKNLIKIAILSIISLALMLINNSLSNMIILAVSYLVVSTIKIIKDKENCTRKLTFIYGMIFVLVLLGITFTFMNQSVRWYRVIGSLNPEADPNGIGYVGMLQKETLQKAKIIGEVENMSISIDDSILNIESCYTFIYIIGKCGLLFGGIIALIVILTSIKLILNAKNIKEEYGKFLIIGLSLLFILQSFTTVLMNINVGIQSNVNLPFVTYGGVYFIVNIVNMAIILSVYRRKNVYVFEDEVKENKNLKIGKWVVSVEKSN